MSINYYEKYMKYKTKYFNLVDNNNKIQHGGTTLGEILRKYTLIKSNISDTLLQHNNNIETLRQLYININIEITQLSQQISELNRELQNINDINKKQILERKRNDAQSKLDEKNIDIRDIDTLLQQLISTRDDIIKSNNKKPV